jgi:hypothetical protein
MDKNLEDTMIQLIQLTDPHRTDLEYLKNAESEHFIG